MRVTFTVQTFSMLDELLLKSNSLISIGTPNCEVSEEAPPQDALAIGKSSVDVVRPQGFRVGGRVEDIGATSTFNNK